MYLYTYIYIYIFIYFFGGDIGLFCGNTGPVKMGFWRRCRINKYIYICKHEKGPFAEIRARFALIAHDEMTYGSLKP